MVVELQKQVQTLSDRLRSAPPEPRPDADVRSHSSRMDYAVAECERLREMNAELQRQLSSYEVAETTRADRARDLEGARQLRRLEREKLEMAAENKRYCTELEKLCAHNAQLVEEGQQLLAEKEVYLLQALYRRKPMPRIFLTLSRIRTDPCVDLETCGSQHFAHAEPRGAACSRSRPPPPPPKFLNPSFSNLRFQRKLLAPKAPKILSWPPEGFLFFPVCLYLKYSEFCGEFKNG